MTTPDRIAAMRIGEAEGWSATVPLGWDDPGASTLDGRDWALIAEEWYRNMETSPTDEAGRWARLLWNQSRQNRARFLASGRGPESPLTPYEVQMQKVALTAAGGPDIDDPLLDPRRVVAECLDRWPPPAKIRAVLASGDRGSEVWNRLRWTSKIRAVLASGDRDSEAWNKLRWTYKNGRWLFRWHDAGWLAPVADPRLPGLLELRPALEAAFAHDPARRRVFVWGVGTDD